MTTPVIDVSVEMTEQIVEVSLPGYRGPLGPAGAQGPQGVQGIQGLLGPEGPQGDVGPQGPEGDQGPQGEPGVDGLGSEWYVGSGVPGGGLGADGDKYLRSNGNVYEKAGGTWTDTGVNLSGPQGATGPQGIQGVQGPQGIPGDDGQEGPPGPQGEDGPQGIQGIQGPQGLVGDDGPPGPQGEDGPQGIQGIQGIQGVEGPQGDEGPAGVEGEGSQWHVGFGVPEDTLGEDQDDYLNLANGDIYQKQTGAYVLVGNIAGPPGEDAVASGSYMLAGGNVVYTGTGYVYRVSAASYFLNGVHTTSPEADVTLDAADATQDRIDVIVLGAAGATKITGTPAANPVEPSIDETAYIRRSVVYVAAASTAATVTVTPIYSEGVEWTLTDAGAGITIDDTVGPRSGTKLIRGAGVTAGQYWEGATAAFDVTLYNSVVFYIDPLAAWPKNKSVRLRWYSGTTARGTAISVANGSYGFNSQASGSYQQVAIPISAFGIPTGTTVTKLRWEIVGSGAAVGFKLDDVQLQGGVGTVDISDVIHWRGTWSNTTAYNKNDVIFKDGSSFIALLPNTGQDPETAATYWTTFAARGIDATDPSDSFSYWDPDAVNGDETASSDEFESATIDPAITLVDVGTLTYDFHTTQKGRLHVSVPVSTAGPRAFLRALPAGDFVAYTKLGLGGRHGDYHYTGLLFSTTNTDGTGSQIGFQIVSSGGIWQLYVQTGTNFNNFSTTLFGPHRWDDNAIYLRVKRIGTTFYFAASADGKTWQNEVSNTPAFTPAYFGPFVLNSSASVTFAVGFEYVRHYTNTATLLGKNRTVGVVEPRPRGVWGVGVSYSINDLVRYGDDTYIAITASSGVTPGTDATKWMLYAQAGPPGDPLNGFTVDIDGGGAPIPVGFRRRVRVPYGCAITGWAISSDVVGSIVIDVRKASYNGAFSTIAGSEKPTLNADDWNQDLTLTTWTPDLTEGQWLELYVESGDLYYASIGFALERAA